MAIAARILRTVARVALDVSRGVRPLFQPLLVLWALSATGAWRERRELLRLLPNR